MELDETAAMTDISNSRRYTTTSSRAMELVLLVVVLYLNCFAESWGEWKTCESDVYA